MRMKCFNECLCYITKFFVKIFQIFRIYLSVFSNLLLPRSRDIAAPKTSSRDILTGEANLTLKLFNTLINAHN